MGPGEDLAGRPAGLGASGGGGLAATCFGSAAAGATSGFCSFGGTTCGGPLSCGLPALAECEAMRAKGTKNKLIK